MENTSFLQLEIPFLIERRTRVYTDPRKQHIAYNIFCGCERANGVEQF